MARSHRILRPNNETEGKFFDWVLEQGYKASKRGWPDFFCIGPNEELMVVEVKPDGRMPTQWQKTIMAALQKAGIPCYLWTPSQGLQEIELEGCIPDVDMVIPYKSNRARTRNVQIKRHEQGHAVTLEQLIKVGKSRGYDRPDLWAKHVLAGRQKMAGP
jgi:hypothetical protein